MTNDARSKLRSMGGIMASSPELMQVAQKFQLGGAVAPMAPPVMPRPLMDQTVMGRGLVPSAPSMPPLAGTIPLVSREMTGDPRRRALAGTAPSFGMGMDGGLGSFDPILEDEIDVDTLLEASQGGGTSVGRRESRRPAPGYTREDVERVSPGRSRSGMAAPSTEELTAEAQRLRKRAAELGLGRKQATTKKRLISQAEKLESQARLDTTDDARADRTFDSVGFASRGSSIVGRDVESLEGLEATGLGGQMRPTREMLDEDIVMSQGIPTPRPGTQADEPGQAMVDAETDIEDVGAAALSSLDKSYEDKLALFNKVFGDADSDKAEDRRMTLATIGLAIAAGQSPDALTNIAQGALAGLGAVGKRREARRAKDEKVKVMALDAALKEQAAQQEFARELGLKTLELGDKSNYDELKQIETPFGKIWARMPTANAMEQGVSPLLVQPELVDSLYKASISERDRVMANVDRAGQLLSESGNEIVGGKASALRTFKKLNNLGFVPDTIYKAVTGDDATLSSFTEYDVIMNNLASELAPILLGESGRTISDGDRAMVARQLGFAVDQSTVNGYDGISITGFVGTGIKSEEGLKASLDAIRSRLNTHYADLDASYKSIRPKAWNDMQKEAKPSKSNVRKFDAQGNPIQ